MFRRQIADRINPRNVLPSRHTLFIRGLPGSTDVTKVKEYFSAETNSKCSVDFFSTSDDKKRLSVAIRFKSHDLAKEMLSKYNNKILLGFPVEMCWFKDFKKARAKVFEEQRQSGGRQFQRMNFRGNFRNNDRRGMTVSPNGFIDGHRARAGSSSSGGIPSGSMDRQRFSRSRSRSFTGSSSRSASISGRSASASPHLRRMPSQIPADNLGSNMRGFPDSHPAAVSDRRIPRNQSYRSVSGSSSSSRSSPNLQSHQTSSSAHPITSKSQAPYQRSRGNASPLGYSQRDNRITASNPQDYSSFTNAPAPDIDGGSSLVSGLIHLKRRNQPESRSSRHRHTSIGSSSSGMSGISPGKTVDPTMGANRRGLGKHISSASPVYGGMAQMNYKSRSTIPDHSALSSDDVSEFPKRKRQRHLNRSPGSPSPSLGSYADQDPAIHHRVAVNQVSYSRQNKHDISKSGRAFNDESFSSEDTGDISARRMIRTSPEVSDWRAPRDSHVNDLDDWARSRHHGSSKGQKISRIVDEPPRGHSTEIETSLPTENFRKRPKNTNELQDDVASVFKDSTEDIVQEEKSDDTFDVIRQYKESLAKDYKRDCEAFTTVVRTLISFSIQYFSPEDGLERWNVNLSRTSTSCTSSALLVCVVVIVVHETKTVLMNLASSVFSFLSRTNPFDFVLPRCYSGPHIDYIHPFLIDGYG